MSSIVASVPGRLRVRHEALRSPALLERLEAKVRACAAVTGVEAKASAASLVVYYDTAQWSEAQSHQRIGTVAATVLPRKVAAPPAPQRPQHPARGLQQGKERRLQANRWAKRAMLGSLAVSMLLAAQGAKRGHALTGLLFLHALGLHLWVHRRNLLK